MNSFSNPPKELEALLTEFQALRAESATLAHSEDSLITTTFSFIAAVIGLNFFFSENTNSGSLGTVIQISQDSSQCMILCICPLLIMFFGCMWMNVLYRRIRFGSYLYLLESDINQHIGQKDLKIYWEHWIINIENGGGFFRKPSRFYGYIVLGPWLFAPILLYVFAYSLFPHWKTTSVLNSIFLYFSKHIIWGLFLGVVFVIYILIMIFFCLEVLYLKNPKHLGPGKRTKTTDAAGQSIDQ